MNDKKQAFLVANCLKLAGDEFSNHTCDDLPNEWFDDWDKEDIVELDKQYHNWNRSPEEHDPTCPLACLGIGFVMNFLASKIEAKALGMTEDDRPIT